MKTSLFILLQFVAAVILNSLATVLFVSLYKDMNPLDWADYLGMITAATTTIAICLTGIIYLKYSGKPGYITKSILFCVIGVATGVIILKIASTIAALAQVTEIIFTGVAGVIVMQLPLITGVIGFNFFLFTKYKQD